MAETDKSKARSIGKYTIYETLGKGGYSWVKKGEDTETGAVVALKFMNRATDQWALEQAEQVRTEIKSLTQVRHENVMKLYAYNLSAKYPLKDGGNVKTILLVLEYCPGGELFDILYYADKMEEDLARTYFCQAINGLKAIHSAGIAHRDLKPQNLLLDSRFQLKITDFGLSKIMETEEDRIMKTTYVGTRGYQAPELLKNSKYTNACDIFSMGVVLFILLAGYPPFEAAHKTDKWYRSLACGDTDKFWHVHRGANIPADAKELLEKMLCYRPKKRISLDDILEHKWFKGTTVDKKDLKKRIIKRFMQARENRKKDAKKAKDLVESEHANKQEQKRGDEAGYKKEWDTQLPPEVPAGEEGRRIRVGMHSFYTERKAGYAIHAIAKVLAREMKMRCIKDTQNPHKVLLACCQKQIVDKVEQTYNFSFAVSAYFERNSRFILLHFNLIEGKDRLLWARLERDIMQTISKYDILAKDGLPTMMVTDMDVDEPAAVEVDESKMATGELRSLELKTTTGYHVGDDVDEEKADDDDAPPDAVEQAAVAANANADANADATTTADAVANAAPPAQSVQA